MNSSDEEDSLKEKLLKVARMLKVWEGQISPNIIDTFYQDSTSQYHTLHAKVYNTSAREKAPDYQELIREVDSLINEIRMPLNWIASDLVDDIEKMMAERVVDQERRSDIMQQLDGIRARGVKPTKIIAAEPDMIIGTLVQIKKEMGTKDLVEKKSTGLLSRLKNIFSFRRGGLAEKKNSSRIIKEAFARSGGENPFKSRGFFDALRRRIRGEYKELDKIPAKDIVEYLVDEKTPLAHAKMILAEKRWFDRGPDLLEKIAAEPIELQNLLEKCSPELAREFKSNQIKLKVQEKYQQVLFQLLEKRVEDFEKKEQPIRGAEVKEGPVSEVRVEPKSEIMKEEIDVAEGNISEEPSGQPSSLSADKKSLAPKIVEKPGLAGHLKRRSSRAGDTGDSENISIEDNKRAPPKSSRTN